MKSIMRPLFSLIIVSAMTISCAILAESAKCSACQLAKSIRDALAQSVKDAQMAALAAGGAYSRDQELDIDCEDASRKPREELVDPCDPCDPYTVCDANDCTININKQLCALRCCCASVAQRLAYQGNEAKKCCKKLKHEIHEVEELVESVIDQNAECCSVIESRIGDPATATIVDLPLCQPISAADSIINGLNVDAITLLKTLLELVYRVHLCTCCNV